MGVMCGHNWRCVKSCDGEGAAFKVAVRKWEVEELLEWWVASELRPRNMDI